MKITCNIVDDSVDETFVTYGLYANEYEKIKVKKWCNEVIKFNFIMGSELFNLILFIL